MASGDRRDRQTTFDALFANGGDPWSLETSAYERAKRTATLDALGDRRFAGALEIGCAYGVLTEKLAPLCDALLAVDISATALERARARLAPHSHVDLLQAEIPLEWPTGRQGSPFDLILISEVLYFLSPGEVAKTSIAARDSIKPGGVCLLVNWTGPNDLPLDGEAAADLFEQSADWHCSLRQHTTHYRLDRLEPRPTAI